MKNINYFSLILCLTFILSMPACEKSTDQSQVTVLGQNDQVYTRGDECEVCPLDCCCCGIEMSGQTDFILQLCGLCEGDYVCGPFSPPSSPCSTVSGNGMDLNFVYPTMARHIFCVEPGASIRIRNPSAVLTVTFKFSCTYDVTPPTYITVTLLPTESKFFFNNGSCLEEGCI